MESKDHKVTRLRLPTGYATVVYYAILHTNNIVHCAFLPSIGMLTSYASNGKKMGRPGALLM
ncbi:MAG: hypothetical protein NVS2B12_21580 [Ktedonobacteraceae bacterium]